jgi:hypothetical protein
VPSGGAQEGETSLARLLFGRRSGDLIVGPGALFPRLSEEEFREIAFALRYLQNGFGLGLTHDEICSMPAGDLAWNLKRLARQREAEVQAMKEAAAKARKG